MNPKVDSAISGSTPFADTEQSEVPHLNDLLARHFARMEEMEQVLSQLETKCYNLGFFAPLPSAAEAVNGDAATHGYLNEFSSQLDRAGTQLARLHIVVSKLNQVI